MASALPTSARQTPNLWRLLQQGSSAALNVTAVHVNKCPIDGWLTLSAGNRTGQPDDGARVPPCQPIPAVKGGFVTGWDSLVAAAAGRPYGSRLGTLSQAPFTRAMDAGVPAQWVTGDEVLPEP